MCHLVTLTCTPPPLRMKTAYSKLFVMKFSLKLDKKFNATFWLIISHPDAMCDTESPEKSVT